jgi:DNA-binding LytR/AlgR family response regulator
MKDYLIYTGSFGKVMVYQRLKDAESQLAASGFVRVHRSFLVNTAKIDRKNAAVVSIGEVEIPIGPTYRERLM